MAAARQPILKLLNVSGCSNLATAMMKEFIQSKKGTLQKIYIKGTKIDANDLKEFVRENQIKTDIDSRVFSQLCQALI